MLFSFVFIFSKFQSIDIADQRIQDINDRKLSEVFRTEEEENIKFLFESEFVYSRITNV